MFSRRRLLAALLVAPLVPMLPMPPRRVIVDRISTHWDTLRETRWTYWQYYDGARHHGLGFTTTAKMVAEDPGIFDRQMDALKIARHQTLYPPVDPPWWKREVVKTLYYGT